MSSITPISIVNSALLKLGQERLVSLDETDLLRCRIMAEQYPKIRDRVLEAFPWTFAQKRAVLAASATAPAWGWSYAYPLPSDYYRLTATHEDFEHEIEGHDLLTDATEVKIKYTALVTDTGKFTPTFAEAVATCLAGDTAYALVQSLDLQKAFNTLYDNMIKEARTSNSQGRGSPRAIETNTILDSRF